MGLNSNIPPLDNDSLPAFLHHRNDIPIVQSYKVCNKLCSLKTHIAACSDEISNRILKEFIYILADPITSIVYTFLHSSVVPRVWKEANVVLIPKINQPDNESDTRPIFLTPVGCMLDD